MDTNEYDVFRLSAHRLDELRRQAAHRAAWIAARGPSPIRRRLGALLVAVGNVLLRDARPGATPAPAPPLRERV